MVPADRYSDQRQDEPMPRLLVLGSSWFLGRAVVDAGPSTYGSGKAGCERAVTTTFGPERATILRPGVILGPHEYVGRLPWWLRRMERGGQVLAPGSPDRKIQPVDVRDVAEFAV